MDAIVLASVFDTIGNTIGRFFLSNGLPFALFVGAVILAVAAGAAATGLGNPSSLSDLRHELDRARRDVELRTSYGWSRYSQEDVDRLKAELASRTSTATRVGAKAAMALAVAAAVAAVGIVGVATIGRADAIGGAQADLWQPTDQAQPTYSERPPLAVCEARLAANLGKDLAGTPIVESVNYIDADRCSMVVDQRSIRTGAVGVVVWDHRTDSFNRCRFDETVASFKGLFGNSLKQNVYETADRTLGLDKAALYGICNDDGGAEAYWPTHRWAGNPLRRYEVHGGLLHIGTDGDIELHDQADAGEFPGPVYPEYLVEDTLQHRRVAGTTWFRRNGWKCPSEEVVYERSGDSGNVGEYTLYHADTPQNADYVTPMQRCGSSTNVVAIARVNATSFEAGTLNDITLHELDDSNVWLPVDELSQIVTANHPEVANSERIHVHEVTPTSPDRWTAYVGNSRAVVYRADIDVQGNTRLQRVDDGAPTADSNDSSTEEPSNDTPLGDLSDEQLLQMLRDAQRDLDRIEGELADRLDG